MKVLKTIGLGLLICIGYPVGYVVVAFILCNVFAPFGWMFWYLTLGETAGYIYLGIWFGCLIGFGIINAFVMAWGIVNGKDW